MTLGEVVSITMSFVFEIDPDAPGVGSVSVASFKAASRIVPAFKPRAEVLE